MLRDALPKFTTHSKPTPSYKQAATTAHPLPHSETNEPVSKVASCTPKRTHCGATPVQALFKRVRADQPSSRCVQAPSARQADLYENTAARLQPAEILFAFSGLRLVAEVVEAYRPVGGGLLQ